MPKKYKVADIEANGVESTATIYGSHRQGWIMRDLDFVDYAGYAQLVMPMPLATDVAIGKWST